jgi:hypothetical protein
VDRVDTAAVDWAVVIVGLNVEVSETDARSGNPADDDAPAADHRDQVAQDIGAMDVADANILGNAAVLASDVHHIAAQISPADVADYDVG